jgi:polyhydroxyalkanoate synthesis regulator phasin
MRQKNKQALNNAQELHNTQMKELKDQIVGLEQQVQDLSDSNKEGRSLYDSETANQ